MPISVSNTAAPHATMPRRMSTFGLVAVWASILGPFLALPLGILGGLLTPKVQSWWARTTNTRRDRRIERIKYLLYKLSRDTNVEQQVTHIARGMWFLAISVDCFFTVIFMHLVTLLLQAQHKAIPFVAMLVIPSVIIGSIGIISISCAIIVFPRGIAYYPEWRINKLKRELESLGVAPDTENGR
jgi:hypothetical protein